MADYPRNTPLQWGLTLVAVLLLVLGALDALPEPDPSVTFTCPNYATIHVLDAHWDSQRRTKRIVRTIPATCGTPQAITFGYLGTPQ